MSPDVVFCWLHVMCLSAGLRPNNLTSVGHGERSGSRWVTRLTASYPSNPSKQPQKRRMGRRRAVERRHGETRCFLASQDQTEHADKSDGSTATSLFLFRGRNKTVVKFLIKKWSRVPQREALTHARPPTSSAFRLQTRRGCRGCG